MNITRSIILGVLLIPFFTANAAVNDAEGSFEVHLDVTHPECRFSDGYTGTENQDLFTINAQTNLNADSAAQVGPGDTIDTEITVSYVFTAIDFQACSGYTFKPSLSTTFDASTEEGISSASIGLEDDTEFTVSPLTALLTVNLSLTLSESNWRSEGASSIMIPFTISAEKQ